VHAMASAPPWNCRLPSEAWVGALGLADNAAIASAKTAVSKTMRRLEERQLITRERSRRLSDIVLLKEDGSGEPYERPNGADDRWLQLPHAYWLDGYYTSLHLPAKVMLLIALFQPDGFPLAYDRAPSGYGVSADSAEEGVRELRRNKLLTAESVWVNAPRSATGWTDHVEYRLQGAFSREERKKASRSSEYVTSPAKDPIGAPDQLVSSDEPAKLPAS
jgi:hypothetical protein